MSDSIKSSQNKPKLITPQSLQQGSGKDDSNSPTIRDFVDQPPVNECIERQRINSQIIFGNEMSTKVIEEDIERELSDWINSDDLHDRQTESSSLHLSVNTTSTLERHLSHHQVKPREIVENVCSRTNTIEPGNEDVEAEGS
ncbi:hypothetical protein NEOLI_004113 [Neolecta irregularis DAH-3]|uniref:Uncharacterized protein n=1 Tax=Neolecta irregularis (strain DAH-3) TaxID=1198029 RepID=A0A1U7LK58_NEOID|nr:hypothetical protein NEOLI_004113 [Neolecta irregularis DAH-3]|eukprot:OLL23037.1 hypothetical protein NEOLI_004113 [Neolecta irregularis DAH-3]